LDDRETLLSALQELTPVDDMDKLEDELQRRESAFPDERSMRMRI
jgi:hypothetical protein